MKVLLINPTTHLVQNSRKLRTFMTPILPTGLGYIASALDNAGNKVKVIDQFANKITDEGLLAEIKKYAPGIIGFSCLTPTISKIEKLAAAIRKFSKASIVLGGTHPTIFAEDILHRKIADVVVRGEGEAAILELVQALEDKRGLSGVRGISFRADATVWHNPDRPLAEDLDRLSYPAWQLFELQHYREVPVAMVHNELIIPMLGSRGCSYKCVFCAQDAIYPRPRYRTSEGIIREMEYMHNRFKVKRFGFADANFPFSVEFGLKFCSDLIRSGLHKKIKWLTEIRVNLLNEELLTMMKKAGAYLIMFGFESGSQRILDKINKSTDLEQARKAMKITRKLKINTLGLFMLGLPGETEQDCEETIRFSKELNPTIAKFNIVVPYPGSKLFSDAFKGRGTIGNPEKFISWCDWADCEDNLVYVPEGMTAKQIVGLQRRAMFEFYARPGVIWDFIVHRRVSLRNLVYGAYVLLSKYLFYLKERIYRRSLFRGGFKSALSRK